MHGQRFHVPAPAAVEVACRSMVRGMAPLPAVIGCERQHAEGAADEIICSARPEKGAVTAVMLDDEKSDEKAGRRDRQQQREPIMFMRCPCHDGEEREERRRCSDELEDAAFDVRAVGGELPG